jgi:hypothetical protein
MHGFFKWLFISIAVVFFIGVVMLGNEPEDVGRWLGGVIGQIFNFFRAMGDGSNSEVS